MKKGILKTSLLLLLFLGSFAPSLRAAGDFVLSPAKVELELRPGQEKTITLTVANRTDEPQSFRVSVEDVVGTQNPSIPLALLGTDRAPATLKDFIRVAVPDFDLAPGKSASVLATVSVPSQASPGSRHAAVLVSAVSPDFESTVPIANNTIVPRVGALFFVKIPGAVKEAGGLREFSTAQRSIFSSDPVTFRILYENTGNVYLNPYGEIRIKNFFGNEVGALEIDPWYVLPESVRTREILWGASDLFGRYTATIRMNQGYGSVIDEETISFWVIPWVYVWGYGALIGVILYIRWFFKRRTSR